MAEAEDGPRGEGKATEPMSQLRREFKELSSDAQQLLTEKLYLENECARLKKRVNSLDEEVRTLRKPPFVVGHVQDILDGRAVVRSSMVLISWSLLTAELKMIISSQELGLL